MISRRLAPAVLVLAAQLASLHAADTVILLNAAAGDDNGVVAWGPGTRETRVGTSPLDIGNISNAVPHVASFAVDHPPALDDYVTWSAGNDKVELSYPERFTVPIKLWILCSNAGCTSPMDPAMKTSLDLCLVWANEHLRDERAGFSLESSGGAAWISDQTGATDPTLTSLRNFDTKRDCPKNLLKASSILSVDGAVNVFMVETVNGQSGLGDSCRTQDKVIIGCDVLCGTLLHEIGHNLSLGHNWTKAMGGKQNIMAKISDTREYFSEGQVFRIHFSDKSGLNTGLTKNPNPAEWPAPRNCNGSAKADCPPIDLLPWGTP